MSEDRKKAHFEKLDWWKEATDAVGEIVLVFTISLITLFGIKDLAFVSVPGVAAVAGAAVAAFGFFGIKCHTLGSPMAHLLSIFLRLYNQRTNKRERMANLTRLIFEIFRIVFQIIAALLAGVVFKAVVGILPGAVLPQSKLLPGSEAAAVVLYGIAVMVDLHLISFPAIMVEDVFGVGFSNGLAQFATTYLSWSIIQIPTNYALAFAVYAASNFAPNVMFAWAHLAILVAIALTFVLYVFLFQSRFSPEAIKTDQAANGGNVAAPILSEKKRSDDVVGSAGRALDHW